MTPVRSRLFETQGLVNEWASHKAMCWGSCLVSDMQQPKGETSGVVAWRKDSQSRVSGNSFTRQMSQLRMIWVIYARDDLALESPLMQEACASEMRDGRAVPQRTQNMGVSVPEGESRIQAMTHLERYLLVDVDGETVKLDA